MTCLATCGILFVLLLILPVFENILQYLQFVFVQAFVSRLLVIPGFFSLLQLFF